ncbi:MAG TPA: BON domain-containing protein [Gemmatimonadales bacterium]|nr:BON domain-containing protein [Gemmatimonadales bacterium]
MKADKELQRDVMDELRYEPSLDEKEIGANASNGLVTLTGRVKSYAEKLAAIRAVERVAGVRAIANELHVAPPQLFEHTDVEIAEAAIRALEWSTSVPHDQVKARIEKGWVTLEGKVDWKFQRDSAEEAIRLLAGVRGVTNLIIVEPAVTPGEVSRKIAAALSRSAALHAQEIKVEARDRKVTLKGTVHSWDERREAEHAAWAAPGVTAVENQLAVVA